MPTLRPGNEGISPDGVGFATKRTLLRLNYAFIGASLPHFRLKVVKNSQSLSFKESKSCTNGFL